MARIEEVRNYYNPVRKTHKKALMSHSKPLSSQKGISACLHRKLSRRGIQYDLHGKPRLVLYNCLKCKSTITKDFNYIRGSVKSSLPS